MRKLQNKSRHNLYIDNDIWKEFEANVYNISAFVEKCMKNHLKYLEKKRFLNETTNDELQLKKNQHNINYTQSLHTNSNFNDENEKIEYIQHGNLNPKLSPDFENELRKRGFKI